MGNLFDDFGLKIKFLFAGAFFLFCLILPIFVLVVIILNVLKEPTNIENTKVSYTNEQSQTNNLPTMEAFPITDHKKHKLDYLFKDREASSPSKYKVVSKGPTPDDVYEEGYENGYEQGSHDSREGHDYGYGYDDSSDYYDYYETKYLEGYENGYDDGYEEGT